MASRSNRGGFSLIEALVVLAISGMALAIIFSIGVKAGDSGFALGRRAISAADQDVSIGDARSLFRSISVRPARAFRPKVDRPLVGSRERFEGEIVAERATQCAPAGWAGIMILTLEPRPGGRALVCRTGDRVVDLLVTRSSDAGLSYSSDGRNWVDDFDSTPSPQAMSEDLRSQNLYVRFRAAGDIDVVEMATSSRPETWIGRFDL